MALTATQVKAFKEPGRYGDGQGLYLNIAPRGSKNWVQRIVIHGKRRELGLGGYPAVSLAEAREKALEIKRKVAAGVDPTARIEGPVMPTFAEAARSTHEANRPRWRNNRHTGAWIATLEKYAFPVLGNMPVDQIQQADVLGVLKPIWGEKQETARRVRQRMSTTFKWAMAHGFIERNPAGEAIDGALPPMPKLKAHHKALPYQDVPAAIETIAESKASLSAKLCFEFTVLTAARSGEARGAEWKEIDLDLTEWRLPANRNKSGKEHRMPLSEAALDVLGRASALKDDTGLVFPSVNGKTLSDSTLSKLVRENGIQGVPHGFRSSFRDWAQENTSASWAAMELSLSHAVGSDVERAYLRSDLLEQRRMLMEDWGRYCKSAGS